MVEQKLEEAKKHKAAGNRRMTKLRIQDAHRILINIERSRLDRLNARYLDRVLGEIEALELAIGGTVERRAQAGGIPLQLTSRDGLYAIRASLTKTQLAAGLAYRDLYEKTDPERTLKPKSIDPRRTSQSAAAARAGRRSAPSSGTRATASTRGFATSPVSVVSPSYMRSPPRAGRSPA